ncbi:hypothetical protein [Pseudoalteromonas sp. Z9A4]|uniref:hypothetical protein n=1 Tax=Pseudoalteromonas sp. Z9A4 TaxID=2686353 RepID=UPI00140B0270|nr:hypothetical protein [Pseudoalteromonas sp. Z9A4]
MRKNLGCSVSINYKNYKNYKNKFKGLSYKGYPLDRVLGSYLIHMEYEGGREFAMRTLFSNAEVNLTNDDLLITYTTERIDYQMLMKAYFPEGRFQCLSSSTSLKAQLKKYYMPIMMSFFSTFVFLKRNNCFLKFNYKELLLLAYSIRVIDNLEKKEIKCKRYIAFNSSYKLESFLSFYFRKRHIPTYSLQHGMYFNYPIDNVPKDIINYENICSQYIFCWGEYSQNVIDKFKYSDTKSIVVGNPLVCPPLKRNHESESIYVLLPRLIYLTESLELLSMLPDNFKYLIRPHPSIKENIEECVLSSKNMTLDTSESGIEMMSKLTFRAVIAFNSTMVFQAVHQEQKLLCFERNTELDLAGFNSFKSVGELNNLLGKEIKNNSSKLSYYKEFEGLNWVL